MLTCFIVYFSVIACDNWENDNDRDNDRQVLSEKNHPVARLYIQLYIQLYIRLYIHGYTRLYIHRLEVISAYRCRTASMILQTCWKCNVTLAPTNIIYSSPGPLVVVLYELAPPLHQRGLYTERKCKPKLCIRKIK